MFKCIALLRRRPDLSRQAFIDYYETRHSVLIRSLLPGIIDYRRNYVETDGAFLFPGAGLMDFHVVTELRFADRAAYDRFVARAAEPDVARQIAEDEAHLFDRSATRMFVVEERASAIAHDPAAALLDERAIMRGLSRFARILDTKQWDRLGDVFAQDIRFDYGTGREEQGMAALTRNMRRFLDRCGGTQHLIGSVIIDLDGDRATSRAYVQARHQRIDDAAGPIFDSNGEYIDQWERQVDGWRIVRRDAIWATHSGDPAILQAGAADLG
ncbi:nuclear transport factor 2 family protein [Sphingobium sp. CAP-1]|uniref:nuclear transport factor 2 family protein n=1 Tax=Sphingobium sp. CAP-1 TaxID=2676077 RepID=UPI0012BB36EB|nr:nuclear transport factor 2 family protein [Sphingobium sp. CAP-1]QGP80514.1 ethyl tert-butyl ether degradation EthD [Sphingobium sp. CAP-1]